MANTGAQYEIGIKRGLNWRQNNKEKVTTSTKQGHTKTDKETLDTKTQ